MNQSFKKDRLGIKFSKIELAINGEDKLFDGMTISPEVEAPKKIRSKGKSIKFFYRAFKLVTESSLIMLKSGGATVTKGLSFSFRKIVTITNFALDKKAEAEVIFDEKISQIEFAIKEHAEALEAEKKKKSALIRNFCTDVQGMYYDTIDHISLNLENDQKLAIIKANTDIQAELLKVIAKKIIDSHMIKNVKKMSVAGSLKSYTMNCEIEMDLEKKGHLWAVMFGKYIVPHLNKVLEGKEGLVQLKHIQNVTKNTDIVKISWEFRLQEGVVVIPEALISQAEKEFERDDVENANDELAYDEGALL